LNQEESNNPLSLMSFCPVDKHFRSRIRVGEEELGFLQLLRQLPHGPPRVITDDLLHPLHHLYAVGITAAPVLLPFYINLVFQSVKCRCYWSRIKLGEEKFGTNLELR